MTITKLLRHGLLLFALTALCAAADLTTAPDSGAKAEKIDSFRGLKFGDTFDKVPKGWDLQPVSQDAPADSPLKAYIRNEEEKQLGGIVLQEIVYYFVNNRFYAVELLTSERTQSEMLRRTLDHAYGSRGGSAPLSESLVWIGKRVTAQYIVSKDTGEGKALMFDNDLQGSYEKIVDEIAQKAALKL